MQTPVLFIVFNRFDTTRIVFDQIRKQTPKQLFIAADGPRKYIQDEKIKCDFIKNWLIANIDWDCRIHTLFRKENIGCGRGPFTAINWFFEHVNEGIILEDDCIPADSFFKFCEENLNRYRNNDNISIISGNNFLPSKSAQFSSDYYFSVFPSTWGWATWKRTWEGYKFIVPKWSYQEEISLKKFLFSDYKYSQWWINQLHCMQNAKPEDMWDFQFYFHCMKRKQLAIIPKVNLVSNIGFGESATHTTDKQSNIANLPTYELEFPLRHPEKIERNYEADLFVQKLLFGEVEPVSPVRQFKRWLKKSINIPKM